MSSVKHTCADIDNVIASIETIVQEAEWVFKRYSEDEGVQEVSNVVDMHARRCYSILEDLRQMNSTLRAEADEYYETRDELDDALYTIEKLELELKEALDGD